MHSDASLQTFRKLRSPSLKFKINSCFAKISNELEPPKKTRFDEDYKSKKLE
jgi:hypothetical protein